MTVREGEETEVAVIRTYNFCWRPSTFIGETPATAAELTNHVWCFHELMGTVRLPP